LAAARDISRLHGQVNHEQAFRKLTDNSVPLSTNPEDIFKVWPTNADRVDFRAVMTTENSIEQSRFDALADAQRGRSRGHVRW
jgi:hypothetical protein